MRSAQIRFEEQRYSSLYYLALGINHVLRFVVGIPPDPMQEGKDIPHGNIDHRNQKPFWVWSQTQKQFCLVTNLGQNLLPYQVNNSAGDAARLGVQQDGIIVFYLGDHEKFGPPMHFHGRNACCLCLVVP
jgi:hypothetical protein